MLALASPKGRPVSCSVWRGAQVGKPCTFPEVRRVGAPPFCGSSEARLLHAPPILRPWKRLLFPLRVR